MPIFYWTFLPGLVGSACDEILFWVRRNGKPIGKREHFGFTLYWLPRIVMWLVGGFAAVLFAYGDLATKPWTSFYLGLGTKALLIRGIKGTGLKID
jgi:hypothetical protein